MGLMGHPDVTVMFHAKGSLCVLQMLNMSCNSLQSILSCLLTILLFWDGSLVISYHNKCVDVGGAPSPWCLKTGTQRQGMYSRSSPEGSELNDAAQLSVSFPTIRTSKAYIPIWHAGSFQQTSRSQPHSLCSCTKRQIWFPSNCPNWVSPWSAQSWLEE